VTVIKPRRVQQKLLNISKVEVSGAQSFEASSELLNSGTDRGATVSAEHNSDVNVSSRSIGWPWGVAYEDGRTGARVQARLGRRAGGQMGKRAKIVYVKRSCVYVLRKVNCHYFHRIHHHHHHQQHHQEDVRRCRCRPHWSHRTLSLVQSSRCSSSVAPCDEVPRLTSPRRTSPGSRHCRSTPATQRSVPYMKSVLTESRDV